MPEFSAPRIKVDGTRSKTRVSCYKCCILVNGVSAYCIDFDVSRAPLSVHQPLWRFISGLFTSSNDILRHYVVDEQLPSVLNENGSSPMPSVDLLSEKVNMKGIRSLLMEMPLRFEGGKVKVSRLPPSSLQGTSTERTVKCKLMAAQRVLTYESTPQLYVPSVPRGDV